MNNRQQCTIEQDELCILQAGIWRQGIHPVLPECIQSFARSTFKPATAIMKFLCRALQWMNLAILDCEKLQCIHIAGSFSNWLLILCLASRPNLHFSFWVFVPKPRIWLDQFLVQCFNIVIGYNVVTNTIFLRKPGQPTMAAHEPLMCKGNQNWIREDWINYYTGVQIAWSLRPENVKLMRFFKTATRPPEFQNSKC